MKFKRGKPLLPPAFKEGDWVKVTGSALVPQGSTGRVEWSGESAGAPYAHVRLSPSRSMGIYFRNLRKLEPREAAIEEAKWALR